MARKKPFKIGDVVQMTAGGPKMTVVGYDELNRCVCRWVLDSRFQETEVHPQALRLYERPEEIE